MKKTIAILFLSIFLCANTEVGQLLKLSNLAEHFTEHHDQDEDKHGISFLDFIAIHYNDSQHHSNQEKDNHQNLPFKTINQSVNNVLAFENIIEFSFRQPNIISVKSSVPFTPEFYNSDVFACIWLPPKLS
ncbi:hypothetical protein E0F91_15540 [Flavobacterium sandaracinum]|uniref:Uncharacterized protein n=1 Tax=Flavobacterium sandaracinum TaxID=2541733 RepID=A0A4R5CQW7_9FLAO|nr:hypothetical protein E0F91_15540 [Flavobacterium sandaracinum]